MAKKNKQVPAPLTFDLPVSSIAKLAAIKKKLGLRSASAVVRLAIESYDFDAFQSSNEKHRQISVRLPEQMKTKLAKFAAKKNASAGALLRVAIVELDPKAAAAKAPAKKAGKKK